MKKRINLILKQKQYQHLEHLFQYVRRAVIVVFVLFLASSVVYFVILLNKQTRIKALTAEKKALLSNLLENKEIEAKFVYFNTKEKNITSILKNDVNFYPYYSLLVDSLKSSSPQATLENVLIEKTKSTQFLLSFPKYDSLLSFFKFIESEDFLKNFNELHLVSLSTAGRGTGDIRMNFSGKFIELK